MMFRCTPSPCKIFFVVVLDQIIDMDTVIFYLQTYLVRKPNPNKMLMNPCLLAKANPKCYVCSEKPEVVLQVNPSTMTLQQLNDKVSLALVHQLFC